MIQMSYLSTATRPMSTDDLLNILNSARANNSSQSITGMLLYMEGTFVQVLEGEEAQLQKLLAIIKRDPRHKDIKVLGKRIIEEREYADWSMGFKRLDKDDLLTVPGFNDFFKNGHSLGDLAYDTKLATQLITHFRTEQKKKNVHDELSMQDDDKFIVFLHFMIRLGVKALAVLMMITVLWCVLDVVVVMYQKMVIPPIQDLAKSDILQVFGAFMIVLIAVEIFINITLYIRSDVIPVKMVVATALMAVARKIIVFDFHDVSAMHVMATGLLVVALGGTYWLLEREFKPHGDT